MAETPTLYVMIGPAGSGKTTFAKRLRAVRVCPDDIRELMFGNAAAQDRPDLVFREAYDLMLDNLCNGFSVAFDATNTTTRARQKILDKASAIQGRRIAVLMNTPMETALRRNAERARIVPPDVIERQYGQLYRDAQTIPEQFDATIVVD